MKIVLKFLAIFFSSLILASIFGYWFGRVNEILLKSLFNVSTGFSSFFMPERTGLWLDGLVLGYAIIFPALVAILERTKKVQLWILVCGFLPILFIIYFAGLSQNFIIFLSIMVGYFIGSLILFIKKTLLAKNK